MTALLLSNLISQETVCFCPQSRSHELPDWPGLRVQPLPLKHFSGQAVCAIYCQRYALHLQLRNQAESLNLPLWEAEIKPSSRFLMERYLNGSVQLLANSQPLDPTTLAPSKTIRATDYITNHKIKASQLSAQFKRHER